MKQVEVTIKIKVNVEDKESLEDISHIPDAFVQFVPTTVFEHKSGKFQAAEIDGYFSAGVAGMKKTTPPPLPDSGE